ncbi:MAG: T9SS type A sorting domain-containing protein [Candidatus Eisenbacteria bacterium]|nr:T9SS type A sorting domain-containing protein [Candidatus Eisenbacteria bacterium]
MNHRNAPLAMALLVAALLAGAAPALADAIIADHTIVAAFEHIPAPVVEDAKTSFEMFYGHTSHGSQIVTGMWMVREEDPLFDYNNGAGTFQFQEYGDDLGHNGDTSWVTPTENALAADPGINLVMWSWCGGCSDNTEAGINTYLDAMDQLEQDYPDVIFVYMTGHLDGTGPSGNLYARNDQIRAYCEANDKVLFDFADIESYDPDGTWHPDEDDGCAWCSAWCSSHDCPSCPSCAHSHCFNCYRKGRAFWWMLCALAADMQAGIDEPARLGLAQNHPNPFGPATTLSYTLGEPGRVTLAVHDLSGRLVATLVDEVKPAGTFETRWNRADRRGRDVAAGVYFVRLSCENNVEVRKLVVVK